MKTLSERVIEAYQATGIQPIDGRWGYENARVKCGCGLTALLVHERPDQFPDVATAVGRIRNRGVVSQAAFASLNSSQIDAFIRGYDGDTPGYLPPDKYGEDCMDAYNEGKKVREHILANGGFYDANN